MSKNGVLGGFSPKWCYGGSILACLFSNHLLEVRVPEGFERNSAHSLKMNRVLRYEGEVPYFAEC